MHIYCTGSGSPAIVLEAGGGNGSVAWGGVQPVGSKHNLVADRADLIEKEVPLFIEQMRGTAPQPTNYGSTITE